jgi:hypothetical protein
VSGGRQVPPKVDYFGRFCHKHAVNYLNERMEHLFGDHSKHAIPDIDSPIAHLDPDPISSIGMKVAGSTHLEPTSSEASLGLVCQSQENHHRSTGFGVVYTVPNPPPVTGAKTIPMSSHFPFMAHCDLRFHHGLPHSALPDWSFPPFDGSSPRSWVKQAKTYFDVCGVESHLWVKVATMHCVGPTLLWLYTLGENSGPKS